MIRNLSCFVGVLILYIFLGGYQAYAVSDTISIGVVVGNDTTAPTTPPFITAVPVASTQIDIAWGTSTDDQNLGGYRLFRDATQIATTTLTNYSDTGLTASTTYTYTVDAFDGFFNISSTSSSTATTTLTASVTPTATTTPSTAGGSLTPRLTSLEITTQQESAQFSWKTNIHTQYVLRWGRTNEHSLGSLKNEIFSRSHATTISDLQRNTKYYFELVSINQQGREYVLKQGSFVTAEEEDVTAPANISDLRAVVENASVYLQWKNPEDTDFVKVRVVRNYLFYPKDPVDGFIVYEGPAESVFDAGVLNEHTDQYYTIYTYDTTGNVSSGAVILTSRNVVLAQGNEAVNIEASPQTIDIAFADIRFIQEKKILQQKDEKVVIDSALPLGLQMPAELLPRHLKTITVTLKNSQEKLQTYMLRSNTEKTMYEALLSNLPEGVYDVTFSIYDYQTELQTVFTGQIISQKSITSNDIQKSSTTQVYVDALSQKSLMYAVLSGSGLLLLLLWWIILLLRRNNED